MAAIVKHIGKLKNTDRRCVVVFPQLPTDPDYALIVDTDSLPDILHTFLIDLVESPAGQKEFELAEALYRNSSPDPNTDMLNCLRNRGLLIKQPISNIVMYPSPNIPVELSEVLKFRRNDPTISASDKIREAEVLEEQARKLRLEAANITAQSPSEVAVKDSSSQIAESSTNSSTGLKTAPVASSNQPSIDPNLPPDMQKILLEEQRKLEENTSNQVREEKTTKKRGRKKKGEDDAS